jgi:hypothetical protein
VSLRSFAIACAMLCGLAVLGGVAGGARAQERNWNQSHDPYIGALGLAAGTTSGAGLAVRWPAFPQTMMGVAGGAWGKSSDLAWNFGVELHYVLRQVGRTRLFLGPAVGFFSDDRDDETNVNASFNIGIETLVRTRTVLKVDVGFTYLGDEETVYPLPQLAVFYYF